MSIRSIKESYFSLFLNFFRLARNGILTIVSLCKQHYHQATAIIKRRNDYHLFFCFFALLIYENEILTTAVLSAMNVYFRKYKKE